MAPHGKQMTPEEKQIIVAFLQQGYSSYKIAEMTGENRRTISKFLRRRRVRESEENLPRSGRGRKREFGETGLCTVCFVRTEDKV